MNEPQDIFKVTELASLGCVCANCKTEIIFRPETAQFHSNECPNCGNSLYPLDQILQVFQMLRNKAEESKLDVRIRIQGGPAKS